LPFSANPTYPIFVPTLNCFVAYVDDFRANMIFGTRKVCFTPLPTYWWTASQYCFGKVFAVWNSPAFYFMHANCPNGDGNQSSFKRFRYYYVNYRTFARRLWPSCSDYDDVMLFLAESIRIFTTWQAIPFKRKFYFKLTFICCHIPHEYVLLCFTFDTVFCHL